MVINKTTLRIQEQRETSIVPLPYLSFAGTKTMLQGKRKAIFGHDQEIIKRKRTSCDNVTNTRSRCSPGTHMKFALSNKTTVLSRHLSECSRTHTRCSDHGVVWKKRLVNLLTSQVRSTSKLNSILNSILEARKNYRRCDRRISNHRGGISNQRINSTKRYRFSVETWVIMKKLIWMTFIIVPPSGDFLTQTMKMEQRMQHTRTEQCFHNTCISRLEEVNKFRLVSYTGYNTTNQKFKGFANVSNNNCQYVVLPSSFDSFFEKNMSREDAMCYEWNRLRSYREFPMDSPMYAIQLARAGFYHNGHRDEVQCFSCGVRHSGWLSGDSPLGIHSHISPNCRFVSGTDVRNVRISNTSDQGGGYGEPTGTSPGLNNHCANGCSTPLADNTDEHASRPSAVAMGVSELVPRESTRSVYSKGATSTEKADLNSRMPNHPHYKVMNVRISSFQNWPMHSGISPKSLAQAGLFYVGFADCVRCFFCGGGLRNWEPQDDPWSEHARWYPRCGYVIHCMGTDFIHRVQNGNEEQPRGSPGTSESSERDTGHNADDFILGSVAAQSVIEMGYTQQTVLKAANTLRETGRNNFGAEELASLILDSEDSDQNSQRLIKQSTSETKEDSKQSEEPEKESDDAAANIDDNIRRLMAENRQMREQSLCRVCAEESSQIVFLPCGHMSTCPSCAPGLTRCPVCSKVIKGTIKAYLP